MNNLFNLQPGQIIKFYHSLSFYKSKDKLDMILEPLQSIIQLALLSITPIGTKLTIQENILYLQIPGITQPINRWYHSDKKDDLIFLFQVIKRFIKWYNPKKYDPIQLESQTQLEPNKKGVKPISSDKSNKKQESNEIVDNDAIKKSPISLELYQLLIKMSIKGLDNLVKTYNSTENNTIIQVIYMYKNLLENNDFAINEYDKLSHDKVNIDEVFEHITQIYEPNVLNLINSSLLMIEKEEDSSFIITFIEGLNMIMSKNNKHIQNWIKVNLHI